MKRLLIVLLFYMFLNPSSSLGEDLHERQLKRGLRNSDTYACMLINKPPVDREEKITELKKAVMLSPDLPEAYFALAAAGFSFKVQDILDSIGNLVEGVNAFSRNFRLSFTFTGFIFFCLFLSLLITFAATAAITLFSDISLISHDIRETPSTAILLPVLALISFLSPLLFIAGILVMTGLYFRRKDKAVVYFYLGFLILSPVLLASASRLVSMASSTGLRAVTQVNESRDNDYALEVLQVNNNFPALFSYALALKRTGQYEQAIAAYKSLLERKADPRVLVNLGNCYVGLYNFEEGKKAYLDEAIGNYSASLKIRPTAAAYYNLSQLSREMLAFSQGEEYFKAALKIDRAAVAAYRSISGRSPNRMVADETLSTAELWSYPTEKRFKADAFGLSVLPIAAVAAIALFLLAAFHMMAGRSGHRAYRCRKCRTILCPKCEKYASWENMCAQCYNSLVRLDGLDAKERVARILSIHDRQRRHRNIMKVLSFILPGAAQIFAGRVLYGVLFMWPFLFFVLVPPAMGSFALGNQHITQMILTAASLCIAAALYSIFNFVTGKRISKGWL